MGKAKRAKSHVGGRLEMVQYEQSLCRNGKIVGAVDGFVPGATSTEKLSCLGLCSGSSLKMLDA